jgi:hypothetical protein
MVYLSLGDLLINIFLNKYTQIQLQRHTKIENYDTIEYYGHWKTDIKKLKKIFLTHYSYMERSYTPRP